MTMPSVRAWRDSLLAGVLALAAMAVLAAAHFTPEERKFVDEMPALLEARCQEGVERSLQEKSQAIRDAASDSVKAMLGPQGVCGCVVKRVMLRMTPELLRSPDAVERVKDYVANDSADCISTALRTSFPAVCPGLATALFAAKGLPEAAPYIPELCRCVQARIDALPAAELRPYLRARIDRDADQVASGPSPAPALPPSLARDMRECHVATANRMLEDAAAEPASSPASQAQ